MYKQTQTQMQTYAFQGLSGWVVRPCQGDGFLLPQVLEITEAGQLMSPHPLGSECVYTGAMGCPQVDNFTSVWAKHPLCCHDPKPSSCRGQEGPDREDTC